MDIFYLIGMTTKNGKHIYLASDTNNSMKWTNRVGEAYHFTTDTEARRFASSYFKSFKAWFITAFDYDLGEVA